MTDIYSFLDQHQIPYVRVDHPPVYTCEEAERLVPPLPGVHTKNLFLRDSKGKQHFLVVVGWEKQVDLKALAAVLKISKLGMASPERLLRYLSVEPGAVTVLGVVNDQQHAVEVVIDIPIWRSPALHCHPLVNTATLAIASEDLERLFKICGTPFRIVNIPSRTAETP
ncbi:MAG: prolyl-tRNA synthetase associated domain-containing protein [Candidatus Latescibacteria bacterium]|nr:prolyl-tRNA synthetase associated domain-containing protein [Candidatus Latescibacterota bacterium]